MSLPLYHVNAFAAQPFRGNPAAVCLLDGPRDDAWMQGVARDMNLSETAFVRPVEAAFSLRWFTPGVEVDLCGHATLASAHVLWETGRVAGGADLAFETRSGTLQARRVGDRVELDFPADLPRQGPAPEGLLAALGVEPVSVARGRFDVLLEVEDEAAVRAAQPDFRRLAAVPVRGVMVTSRSAAEGLDFVSRFFAPHAGVDEDPVTGSAHCCLGPYWGERLGKTRMHAAQLSARGGEVEVELAGARVLLRGSAVTVSRGELLV